MVRPIVKDVQFLGQKSLPASNRDMALIGDMKDTLKANRSRCVGMAANMVGELKRIIIFTEGRSDTVMVNPRIVVRKGPYETEEGCLSLEGVRKTVRYGEITVEYLDESFRKRKKTYSGFTAQIIQHECDHLDGIVI